MLVQVLIAIMCWQIIHRVQLLPSRLGGRLKPLLKIGVPSWLQERLVGVLTA